MQTKPTPQTNQVKTNKKKSRKKQWNQNKTPNKSQTKWKQNRAERK